MFEWFRKYVRKIGIFGVEVEFHPPDAAPGPAGGSPKGAGLLTGAAPTGTDPPQGPVAGGEVYEDFSTFMRAVVLPRRATRPADIRLDGARTGGSRGVAGRFRHHGRMWVVHEDTHYEPLALAYGAAQAGSDPFVEEDTARGRCLALVPELRARQQSPHKYLYIYSWFSAGKPA
jgi:hypothetical protein